MTREAVSSPSRSHFEELFRSHYDALWSYAATYVESPVAEELVQDVFLEIWERRHDVELSRLSRAYLFRALRNRVLNQLRRRRVEMRWRDRARHDPPRLAPSAADDAQLAAAMATVRAVIDGFPARRREVFLLVRQGLSYAEAGDVLGISRKTVDAQMVKAMTALRNALYGGDVRPS